ncbi:MAG: AMP-binding protein, partial [Myxococcales bacterium]|nr:AMP-binding protein [Myxococcales bacterium]
GYGLTETSPLASYNHETRYRLGSIGVPIEGVDMKVVGEDGSDCSPGQWGEICIRGPNVMAGYFRNDEETALAMRGSWFRSGDIGYCDRDGYYFLVDRQKDMINRSGFKIWPREVEEVLYRHAAVKECAVVGTAHPTHGESVVAYIMRAEGSAVSVQALREHCRAQLAGYKVPERFVLEAPIPKNASGKILKQELRRRASEDAP